MVNLWHLSIPCFRQQFSIKGFIIVGENGMLNAVPSTDVLCLWATFMVKQLAQCCLQRTSSDWVTVQDTP